MNNKVKVKQHAKPLPRVDGADALIIVLPKAYIKGAWPTFPFSDVLKKRLTARAAQHCSSDSAGTPFVTDLPNDAGANWGIETGNDNPLLRLADEFVGQILD